MQTNSNKSETLAALDSMRLLSGRLPESIRTGTFLLVGSGETYFTETVKGQDLVTRMMTAMYGDAPDEWNPEDINYWHEQIADPDNWCHGYYGPTEPTEYKADVGETDCIRLFRMTHTDAA